MACKRHNVKVKSLCSLIVIIMLVLPSLVPAAERDGKNKEGVVCCTRSMWHLAKDRAYSIEPQAVVAEKNADLYYQFLGQWHQIETIFSKIAEVIRERQARCYCNDQRTQYRIFFR